MWEPVEPAKQETQPAAKPAEEHGEADQDAEGLFEADAPSPSEIWEEEIAECDDPILLDTTPEGVARDRAEESAADAAEEGERRPRRRRRRRGRGKGRRTEGQTEGRPNEPAAPGSAPTAGVETPASAENASSEELEVGVERVADAECIEEGLAGESAQPAGQEGERTSAEPRGRRRRSRRGQRRDERPRENRPEPAPASAESPAEEAEDDDADEPLSLNEDVLGEVGEEESGDELDADGESSKWAHRAIPTWEEAIGYVVGRNLESRAKNPNAGGPRNRGGQGRSRGGRRHD
jgi:ribonuclease E